MTTNVFFGGEADGEVICTTDEMPWSVWMTLEDYGEITEMSTLLEKSTNYLKLAQVDSFCGFFSVDAENISPRLTLERWIAQWN